MARLFGTDGVRGLAGADLTGELAYALGRSAVLALSGGQGRPSVLIGRDPRASGEFLEAALAAGVCSAGGDVLTVGIATTPEVAFLIKDLGVAAGAMISASHNPPEYNGIKFFDHAGYKLPDDVEDRIEAGLNHPVPNAQGLDVGRIRSAGDARSRYVRHLVGAALGPLHGMRVVVDCANGSASGIAPEALRALGADVQAIHESPDGTNINLDCGATHPEVVARAVVEAGADAGVAHDGDADRALFSDAGGNVVDGDQVLVACGTAMRDTGSLSKGAVVTTVMANLGLHRAFEAAGIEVRTTKVGDRYVLEEMLRAGAALGGEQSGHIIFSEHATTGDGILTAIRFLSLAASAGRTVAELAGGMRRFPQVLENVPVTDRGGLDGCDPVWAAVAAAEAELGRSGRVLVRASGTEPLVRVMVEAETGDLARRHADDLVDVVRRELS